MNIQFSNVIPEPLSSIHHKSGSIWNADFTIKSGEKILLNAASGKGKTTFTHLLMGIRSDYSGDIFFDGKNIESMMLDEWVRIRKNIIAVVYQDLQLFPELTAIENVIVKNQLTQVLTISEIEFMFEQVGLIDKRNQITATLSMGQKQRVAIIRALCQPFEWLVLDEPFSHLDNENREICFKIISGRCSMSNAGMILTSLDEMDISDFDKQLKL